MVLPNFFAVSELFSVNIPELYTFSCKVCSQTKQNHFHLMKKLLKYLIIDNLSFQNKKITNSHKLPIRNFSQFQSQLVLIHQNLKRLPSKVDLQLSTSL